MPCCLLHSLLHVFMGARIALYGRLAKTLYLLLVSILTEFDTVIYDVADNIFWRILFKMGFYYTQILTVITTKFNQQFLFAMYAN